LASGCEATPDGLRNEDALALQAASDPRPAYADVNPFALELPVVLVVGLRLGCLNHAYLSARAIEADGCRLAGWIGTGVDPGMQRVEENRALLAARLPVPCLGWLPWQAAP